jgi:hypothetical protein
MENRVTVLLFYIVMFLAIVSCDCVTDGNGIVVDAHTGLPLDSVIVKSYVNRVNDRFFQSQMVTDSTGEFSGSTGLTGGFFGCPDLVIELSKGGYVSTKIKNPNNASVRLTK